MINLFAQDNRARLTRRETELKRYFVSRLTSPQEIDKKLQRKINQWMSLKHYEHLRSDNPNANHMRPIINQWFTKYAKNLDASVDKLIKDFPLQCAQNIFELVMADMISKKYDLIEKADAPDLRFDKYFMECTTNTSSTMDGWDTLLPVFDDIFNIFEMMNEKSRIPERWFFEPWISDTCNKLSEIDNEILRSKLLKIFPEKTDIASSVCSLIHTFRYACMYFKEIIPDEILEQLSKLKFPLQSISGQYHNFDFLAKRLVMSLCDKLQKQYFLEGSPGVIAVSLSMATPGISLSKIETKEFLKHLEIHLFRISRLVLGSIEIEKRSNIINGINNLYAVIIDTCWCNWFPNLIEIEWGPHENIYCAIYNEDYANHDHGEAIFDSLLPHKLSLPFGKCISQVSIENPPI